MPKVWTPSPCAVSLTVSTSPPWPSTATIPIALVFSTRWLGRDFKAGHSPTANVLVNVVQEGMEAGVFCKDDAWEIVFAMGALSHGLIMLYLGGRTNMTSARFRDFYRESFRRYLRGIRK